MKTGDMYNTALANPKATFLRKSDGYRYQFTERGYLQCCQPYTRFVIPKPDEEWKLVREPVTWQEAIQAWIDGKTFKVVVDGREYKQCDHEPLGIFKGQTGFFTIMFTHGKWYIED